MAGLHRTLRSWAPAGLVLIALITHLAAIRNGWLWDDGDNVTACVPVQTWGGLAQIWTNPYLIQQYYPVIHSSFWLEHKLWGLHPLGFHAVNVLLHALNAWLVWRVARRLGFSETAAFITGALFAVHPVQVETVAWVTERKNTLSFALYAGSALWWIRWAGLETGPNARAGDRRALAISFLLFVLALLAKSVTSTLPIVLLILGWWKRGRWTRRELWLAPYFVAALGSGLLTIHLEAHNAGTERLRALFSGPTERVLLAGRALWFYAAKLIFPTGLTFIYPRWNLGERPLLAWLYPILAVAVLVGLFAARGKMGRGPFAGVLAWVVTLSPMLGFVDVFYFRYSFVADHFQYHASAFAFALAGQGIGRWVDGANRARARVGRWAVAGLLAAFAMVASDRVGAFRDVQTLWTRALERNPAAWIAWNNLGEQALDQGRTEDAERLFRSALDRDSTAHEAWNNLGVCLMNRGRAAEAAPAFQRAIELHPADIMAAENLGRSLFLSGQYGDAIRTLRAVVAMPQHGPEPELDLAGALARTGSANEAEQICREAKTRYPTDSRFDLMLANLLLVRGAPAEAVQVLEAAATAGGRRDAFLLDRLAVTLAAAGRFSDAERVLEEALALHPGPRPEAVLQEHLGKIRSGAVPR